ncbi:MAG: hypothetical protein JXA30_17600 [Deltaproteobacteria bacterium]|nr:hypothetical protein [Deltaproteobacteria bacterium]
MQKALDWTLESADALGVEAVVIPTPSGFATSRRERDLFASFADRLPRDKRRIWVWETNGLWDSDKSYPFAEKLGLICAFDPLMEAAPQSDVLYARFTALGVRTHISESMLSEALRTLIKPSIKTVYAVFDFKGSTRRAKLLKKLAQAPHFP